MTQLMTTEVCILRLRKCQNPRHWTFESNTRALTIPYPREPLQLAITKIKQTRNSISESHLAWFLHKAKTGSLCFALYWSCIHFFRFEFWLGFCTYLCMIPCLKHIAIISLYFLAMYLWTTLAKCTKFLNNKISSCRFYCPNLQTSN